MTAIDDAWSKHRRDTAGRERPRCSDLEAGFRAGWKAAMRYRDAQGEPVGLFGNPEKAAAPSGPAWTPARRGSSTSLAAAHSMAKTGRAKAVRAAVLEVIRTDGPLTDLQISRKLGIPENTARPRRIELQRDGLVRPGPTVRNPSGRNAVAYVLVDSARERSSVQTVDRRGDRDD